MGIASPHFLWRHIQGTLSRVTYFHLCRTLVKLVEKKTKKKFVLSLLLLFPLQSFDSLTATFKGL